MTQKVVIVGNGIAGVFVAARLRALSDDVEVEIFTREPYEYYSRIRLPEVCCTNLTPDEILVYKPDWYEQRKIIVHKNALVTRIDRAAKEIVLEGGKRVTYDKLVLAMGSDSFIPPIENVDLEGVFTIREYGDADAIRRYIQVNTKHAVVIGGGLLGLESAKHISISGVETTTILEVFPRLLPRQLDAEGATLLKRIVERMGCVVELGVVVEAFEGNRRVTGVRLKDGRVLPAETVLISAGIRPRIKLAREAGLETNRGIVVDAHLRSSDKDIYVAGDLVEFNGIVWGIIPAAVDHAPVVANNILGNEHIKYRQTIPKNTLKVVGIYLTSLGKVVLDEDDEEGGQKYGVYKKMDWEIERYEKYVIRDGKLVGTILLGSNENLKWVNAKIGREVTASEVEERFW
ncbi:MAG: NAD(P)/FAD-dependent oxidoreductase [Promethearchaeota archaeon]